MIKKMKNSTKILCGLVIVILLCGGYVIATRNKLVQQEQEAKQAFADVQKAHGLPRGNLHIQIVPCIHCRALLSEFCKVLPVETAIYLKFDARFRFILNRYELYALYFALIILIPTSIGKV